MIFEAKNRSPRGATCRFSWDTLRGDSVAITTKELASCKKRRENEFRQKIDEKTRSTSSTRKRPKILRSLQVYFQKSHQKSSTPAPPRINFCSFLVASVDEFSKNGSTNEILGGAGVDDFFNRFQTGSTIGNSSANTVRSTTFSIVLNRAKSRRLSTTFRTHAVSSDPTQNSGCRDKRDATRANCPV